MKDSSRRQSKCPQEKSGQSRLASFVEKIVQNVLLTHTFPPIVQAKAAFDAGKQAINKYIEIFNDGLMLELNKLTPIWATDNSDMCLLNSWCLKIRLSSFMRTVGGDLTLTSFHSQLYRFAIFPFVNYTHFENEQSIYMPRGLHSELHWIILMILFVHHYFVCSICWELSYFSVGVSTILDDYFNKVCYCTLLEKTQIYDRSIFGKVGNL